MSDFKYCPFCGKSITGDMRFCPYCGKSLPTSNSTPPVKETPKEAPKEEKKEPPLFEVNDYDCRLRSIRDRTLSKVEIPDKVKIIDSGVFRAN